MGSNGKIGWVLIVAILAIVMASGCVGRKAKAPDQVAEAQEAAGNSRTLLGPASVPVANNLRLFVVVGAALVAAGAVGGFIFRSPAMLVTLGGTGLCLGASATVFSQFPGFLLVVFAGGLALLAFHIVMNARTIDKKTEAEKYLTLAVESSPGGQDVKATLNSMGEEAVDTVKAVITPIKKALRRAKAVTTPKPTRKPARTVVK